MFTKRTKPAICKPLYLLVLARLLIASHETIRSIRDAIKEQEHTLVELLLLLLLFPFAVLLVKQQTMVYISYISMVF
jgi:hypothetical protein